MLCMMLCSGFIVYDTLASTRHEVTAVLWWYRNVRFIWETQWRLRFFAITGWGHELLCQHDMIIMNDYLNNFISSWFLRFCSAGSVSSFSRAGYHVLSELGMWFAQVGLANWRPIIVKDAMYDVMQRLHSLWHACIYQTRSHSCPLMIPKR